VRRSSGGRLQAEHPGADAAANLIGVVVLTDLRQRPVPALALIDPASAGADVAVQSTQREHRSREPGAPHLLADKPARPRRPPHRWEKAPRRGPREPATPPPSATPTRGPRRKTICGSPFLVSLGAGVPLVPIQIGVEKAPPRGTPRGCFLPASAMGAGRCSRDPKGLPGARAARAAQRELRGREPGAPHLLCGQAGTAFGWQTRMDNALKEWVAAHPMDSRDRGSWSRTTVTHSVYSSYRESILSHVFVGQLLRSLWFRSETEVEVLKPEVDSAGYDFAIECRNQLRHIQLKSSFLSSKTQSVTVNARLASKIAGCVIWVCFDQDSLEPKSFHWFGAGPGEPVPDLEKYPLARHARANSLGIKAKRSQFRRVPKSKFKKLDSMDEVIERLFKV
jgi:hypothetical protein